MVIHEYALDQLESKRLVELWHPTGGNCWCSPLTKAELNQVHHVIRSTSTVAGVFFFLSSTQSLLLE